MAKVIKSKSKSSKVAAMAALAGASAFAGEAQAAEADAEMVAASSLNTVASTRRLDDGTLEIVLTNGEIVTLDSGSFSEKLGEFFFSPAALANAAGDGSAVLIAGGIAAVAGAIAVAASGGGDDAAPAPAPEPAADTNVPTAGDDNLQGTAGDDTIDGLEGNDVIEGLAGDDNLSGSAGNDTLRGGDGNDVLAGGGGTDIIEGGAGIDTNSFQGIGADVEANIAEGTAVYTAPSGTVINETFTDIENLTGFTGNDTLIGDSNANVLDGGDGNDTLQGGGGADTLIGGAGDDVLAGGGGTDIIDGGEGVDTNSFAGIGLGVTATVAADGTGTADYGMVNEIFEGIENLTGSDNDDVLVATGGAANTLIGGLGDDFISGGGGADITDGGEGNDTVSFADIGQSVTVSVDQNGDGSAVYLAPSGAEIVDTLTSFENFEAREGDGDTLDLSSFNTGVRVDLDTNTPQPGPASQDGVVQVAGEDLFTVTDFENIVGTDFDDVLLGNNEINVIDGGAGNDSIHSFGGADTIDGGEGIDTLLLTATPAGTVVTLDATGSGTVVINGNDADVFSNFENIAGSNAGDDILTGNQGDNVLTGNGGNDTLSGGDGDDVLVGGGGTDIIDGGAGIDTNSFAGIGLGVTATVAADGTGTADYGSVNETFTGIENLTGSDNDDVLVATGAAANTLIGGLGDDFISGGGGADITDGGEGNDTVSFADIGQSVTVSVDQNGDGSAVYLAPSGAEIVDTLTSFENFEARTGDGDTLDLSSFSTPQEGLPGDFNGVIVDLDVNSAGANGTPGQQGGFLNAPPGAVAVGGVVPDANITGNLIDFENLIGTDFNDGLFGNNEANIINGGAGNDLIHGFAGDDTLDGGEGTDTVLFSAAPAGVDVDLVAGTATGGAGNNTISNFENVTGSQSDDTISGDANDNVLIGNGGNDTLTGGDGDDILVGGGGTDIIDGGAGIDTNSFAGIGLGVTATVAADGTGTASYGSVNESFTGIENLTGSDNDDVLIATGAAANTISGGAGDDIIAGGGGTDILDGGEGNDTNSFQGIGVDVTASLADGTATYTAPSGTVINETFTNFENLTGFTGNDTLIGDSNANVLDGGDGNDTLQGGGGADTLTGGDGDDVLVGGGGTDVIDGGAGIDTNSFAGIGLGVTATVAADGTGTAEYGSVNETFTGIENLTGSDNNDVLIATGAAANTIFGGAGDDIIAGGGGTDILDGGEGNDTNSFQGIGVDVTANLADGTATYTAPSGTVINETFTNFENLTGFTGNDTLIGDSGANILTGGEGDDTLTGGDGADSFVVQANSGDDTITDFENGVDTIDIQDFGSGFDLDAAIAAAVQDGANTVVTLDGSTTVTLQDFTLADLDASDFLVASAPAMAVQQSAPTFTDLSVGEDAVASSFEMESVEEMSEFTADEVANDFENLDGPDSLSDANLSTLFEMG